MCVACEGRAAGSRACQAAPQSHPPQHAQMPQCPALTAHNSQYYHPHAHTHNQVLARVISALVDRQSRPSAHVPYRDSRLTFLLQESLGACASGADT